MAMQRAVTEKPQAAEKKALRQEARRLQRVLAPLGYKEAECRLFAPLTLRINRLKKEKNAVVLAHYYQRPEIQFGVGDFRGDSLALARAAQNTRADIILFCGVHFMAETAKILNPEKKVLLPSLEAGCSLSESITARDVRALKKKHPGAPVVTYINTSAAVKAESDIVCTSANAEKIIRAQESDTVIFLPDKFMGQNLAARTGKNIVLWDGTCVVHETFNPGQIRLYRKSYPGLKVMAHLECTPAVLAASDYAGGTSGMLRYAQKTRARRFLVITECGLSDYLRERLPKKTFISTCNICPYMKRIHLENALYALEKEAPEVTVPPRTAARARKALQRMLAYR